MPYIKPKWKWVSARRLADHSFLIAEVKVPSVRDVVTQRTSFLWKHSEFSVHHNHKQQVVCGQASQLEQKQTDTNVLVLQLCSCIVSIGQTCATQLACRCVVTKELTYSFFLYSFTCVRRNNFERSSINALPLLWGTAKIHYIFSKSWINSPLLLPQPQSCCQFEFPQLSSLQTRIPILILHYFHALQILVCALIDTIASECDSYN